MSRSPAIVAAALAVLEGSTLEECLASVTKSYPADVLPALWDEVCEAVASGWSGSEV